MYKFYTHFLILTSKFRKCIYCTTLHGVKLSKVNTRMPTEVSLCPASRRCAFATNQSELIRPLEIITVPHHMGGVRIIPFIMRIFNTNRFSLYNTLKIVIICVLLRSHMIYTVS